MMKVIAQFQGEKVEHLYSAGIISIQLRKNKVGCLFYIIYKDKRIIKTIQILKENLEDYMYNLRVTFLIKTGNPKAVREKRDKFDYIKM